MYKYSMLIQWSEPDQCYIISVPDLPGCMSDGQTPEEALENIQIIIDEWLETAKMQNRPIPEPSTFMELTEI